MTKKPNHVQALGDNLLQGLKETTKGKAKTVMNVSDRYIVGDRGLSLGKISEILLGSNRLYQFNKNIVFERHSQVEGRSLVPLMVENKLEQGAPAQVSNLFHCAVPGKDDLLTCQVPPKVLSEVLNNEATRDKVRRVSFYGKRPMFNKDFALCGPGYHPGHSLLIHSETISPIPWNPPESKQALDRLPPTLKKVFGDFCFHTDADLANSLAMMLTGVLANHFVDDGKPLFLLNGNQRGVGKTLLTAATGLILDGDIPVPVQYTDDQDELNKRLGAKLRPGKINSLLLFDNLKGTIGGGLLESQVLSPRVSVRLLGQSEDIERSNDFLWVFTANDARATPDITSRAVIIQLRHEGDPKDYYASRGTSEEKLKSFIREQRSKILGELFGMITRWCEAGKPPRQSQHRLLRWSVLIGGILQVAGFPEFLANVDATLELDAGLQELITLAEHVLATNNKKLYVIGPASGQAVGQIATEWLTTFQGAGVGVKELADAPTDKQRAVIVGKLFSSRLNRTVPVTCGDQSGTATLRCQSGRARAKCYWFEIQWTLGADEIQTAPAPEAAEASSTPVANIPTVITSLANSDQTEPTVPSTGSSSESPCGSGNELDWS